MSAVTHASGRQRLAPARPETGLLRGRFHAPDVPRHFVRRERLLRLLDDLTDYPVTAVVAPAGSGKTVLAADWLAQCRHPCAWLTLDDADRDALELRRSLVAALAELVPGTIAEDPPASDEDLSTLLAEAARADHAAASATLVIDDVHRVDDEAATRVLTTFVEQRPPWLHLLLLSRRTPGVPVDRLRANGELVDLDFGALRFSHEESAALLSSLCPDLPADDRGAAVRRADGWAAAVQLTALAIRSGRFAAQQWSFTPSDPGAERMVNQYLWAEVLRPESPELVGLLLSTAVTERFNCGLAEALTERSDVGDLLEDAVAAGLFLTPLEEGWFEVHSLVRDLLLTRLQRRWPDGVRKQHARAAQWFENVGDRPAALDHWLRAERYADALRVLSELALPWLDSGRSAELLDAIDLVPADAVNADPVSAIRYSWCRLVAEPAHHLDAVSAAEALSVDAPEPSRSRLETLRAVSWWYRADRHRAAETARKALAATGAGESDPVERFGWRLFTSTIALDERWDDRAPEVLGARAACLVDGASRWAFEGSRAVGLALAGRPLESQRVVEDAMRVAGAGPHATGHLLLAGAIAARELDAREAAGAVLEAMVGTPTYPDPLLQLVAQLELVRLRMGAGDLDGATLALESSEKLHAQLARASGGAGTGTLPTNVSPCDLVARVGVDLALATDDPATARRWAGDVSEPFWGPVCEAKILLACGRNDEAAQAARRALPRSPRHEVIWGLLLARTLAARDRTAAAEVVVDTLDLAARHAMLRTVASEGAPVMELIELAAWRVPGAWMDQLRHAMVPVWTGQDAQRPIDDLTDREREVLRLLPSRLTLSEVASELYVSQNTVKFHVRAIYRKLGVMSRSEAVDAARRRRLLPP
jgi:LuxR family maltose regulon positive regulatory protein